MNLNNMKRKIKFGDTIEFDEIFSHVLYIKDKNLYDVKLIDVNESDINVNKPIKDGLLHKKEKYPAGYRKIIFSKYIGNGIVIGQTMKKEGHYWPGYGPSAPDWDAEPPSFDTKKVYSFWIVAIGLNQKVLVPKIKEETPQKKYKSNRYSGHYGSQGD